MKRLWKLILHLSLLGNVSSPSQERRLPGVEEFRLRKDVSAAVRELVEAVVEREEEEGSVEEEEEENVEEDEEKVSVFEQHGIEIRSTLTNTLTRHDCTDCRLGGHQKSSQTSSDRENAFGQSFT